MEMKSKFFPELTTRELYEIPKARAENTTEWRNGRNKEQRESEYWLKTA